MRQSTAALLDTLAHALRRIIPEEQQCQRRQQAEGGKQRQAASRRHAGDKPDDGWLEQIVKDVGLEDRLSHRPSELSGGQQQRVAIARALISKPTVLFADEPTGNLDSATSQEILDLLRRSVDEYGQTIVMVTHDARAAAVAHRVLFLGDGSIVRELGECDPHTIHAVMDELAAA